MKQSLACMMLLATLMAFSGCSNVGTNFETNLANQIQNGKTTQSEVEAMFGQPFKTGVQNGRPLWLYEFDQYRAFGDDSSKDLTIVFNPDGKVRSHQIMSTNSPDDNSGAGGGKGKSRPASGSGASSGSGDSAGAKNKGTASNNYNCGACNTTYTK